MVSPSGTFPDNTIIFAVFLNDAISCSVNHKSLMMSSVSSFIAEGTESFSSSCTAKCTLRCRSSLMKEEGSWSGLISVFIVDL